MSVRDKDRHNMLVCVFVRLCVCVPGIPCIMGTKCPYKDRNTSDF